MANTYTQLYVHVVFAVKGRQNLLRKEIRDDIVKYMAGIIKNKGQKPIKINGMSDHFHLLIGIKPDIAISDLVRDIKANSSKYINSNKLVLGRFEWQSGFGAFSCSHSKLRTVINYIENQEKHHSKQSFNDEFIEFLNKNNMDYKPEYLFEKTLGK